MIREDEDWAAIIAQAAAAIDGGEVQRALRLYDGFIERRPAFAEAYFKRAVALGKIPDLELALADYDRALMLDPRHGRALCNRGSVLERLHRLDEALRSYDSAISIDPGDSLSHYNRASVLRQWRRWREALVSYENAIALKPDFSEAYVNRGNVLQELGRDAEAVESYERAIDLNPAFAEAFQGLGTSLSNLRQFEAAFNAFDRALKLNPAQKFILGARRQMQMENCDWEGLSRDIDSIVSGLADGRAVCPPYTMLALVDSPVSHRLAAEIWMAVQFPPDPALGAIPVRQAHERIKVGYFSADFRDHAVSRLAAELFELHDRRKFEITAFAFGPDVSDEVRSRLERAFDRFLDVRAYSDAEVASLARQHQIDIAVDLGGYTEHCRTGIFAMRAAPIQVSYLGYLGTMGAPYMDYLLADATIIPETERQQYVENLVYLPSYQVNDSKRASGSRNFARRELGLPSAGFVFSCFNSNYKIMPTTFATWMRILSRVPDSSLFIYAGSEPVERNLRKAAVSCGVDSRRLVFGGRLHRQDYLARFRAMDLFLDTLPYNAGTTASDALWAGLPVLTCAGRAFAGRMAASVLTAIDLPEMITSTADEYENMAVQLAENPDLFRRIKEKLVRNRANTLLFDTPKFTANLEGAYLKMMKRYRAGLPPDHIDVST